MRRQQRMVGRVPHDGLEGAGTLGLGGDRLVANVARRQLDPVPDDHVRGDQLGERVERTTAELRLRAGARQLPGEPVRAPTSLSASQGIASPRTTIHPHGPSLAALRLLLGLGSRWSVEENPVP